MAHFSFPKCILWNNRESEYDNLFVWKPMMTFIMDDVDDDEGDKPNIVTERQQERERERER